MHIGSGRIHVVGESYTASFERGAIQLSQPERFKHTLDSYLFATDPNALGYIPVTTAARDILEKSMPVGFVGPKVFEEIHAVESESDLMHQILMYVTGGLGEFRMKHV